MWRASLAALVISLSSGHSAAEIFLLEVSGSPAIEFRANCKLINEAQDIEHAELNGSIPETYEIDAEAASCKIQKLDDIGRLTVTLSADDEIIASKSTAAPFNWIRVRSDGPWGRAKATRGAQRVIRPHGTKRKRLIPNLPTDLVRPPQRKR